VCCISAANPTPPIKYKNGNAGITYRIPRLSAQIVCPANNTNGGSKKNKPKAPAWNTITVDVLNGSGISGAAAAASTTLSGAGWHTGVTGDAGTETTTTTVVYAPGHKTEAQVVADKLGLPAPVPIASAAGVPSTATTGVAVVLGPDGLPG